MVNPSPFERLLQQASELAASDPGAAFDRLVDLEGKVQENLDVRRLGALIAHIGGGALGRFSATIDALERCLAHHSVDPEDETGRSLRRALGVVQICSGKKELGETTLNAAVSTPAERARCDALISQTLAARGRLGPANDYLVAAARAAADLPPDDEVRMQVATLSATVGQVAESRLRQARTLARTAADTAMLAGQAWQDRHRLQTGRGRSMILAGRPVEALGVVAELMFLERQHEAGPEFQIFSAALAAQAQTARGQFKVARAARAACDDLLGMIDRQQVRQVAERMLSDIDSEMAAATEAAGSAAGVG